MWKQFGGCEEGGARINSTIQRLISSLPTDAQRLFGIGRVQYIRRDISYQGIFELGQYCSMPFLLKLEDHTDEREIRLFERFHRAEFYWDVQEEQPPCTRLESAAQIS